MKKPILGIGILFFIIFILEVKEKYPDFKLSTIGSNSPFIPNPCRDIITKIHQLKDDEKWFLKCEGQKMSVIIPYNLSESKDVSNASESQMKQIGYKILANSLFEISRLSNEETLFIIPEVTVQINLENSKFIGIITGMNLAKMKHVTKTDLLKNYLNKNVKTYFITK